MESIFLVLTTMPDMPAAQAMARMLVEKKLAACVNCLPGVHSTYRWQGAVEEAQEVSLIIKTRQSIYQDLESAIRAAHPYQLPEIVALPLAAGLPPYLAWVTQESGGQIDI